MTLDELKKILKNGSEKAKYEAIEKNLELLNKDIFYLLFDLLKDSSFQNRFFALFNLIDKFSKPLANIEGVFIDDIYNLLFDEFAPIIDRAIWALSIIGDKAIDKLREEYHCGTINTKIQIIYAIDRGNFSQRTQDRVEILLAGLNQKMKI